jgi:hypothetical protein
LKTNIRAVLYVCTAYFFLFIDERPYQWTVWHYQNFSFPLLSEFFFLDKEHCRNSPTFSWFFNLDVKHFWSLSTWIKNTVGFFQFGWHSIKESPTCLLNTFSVSLTVWSCVIRSRCQNVTMGFFAVVHIVHQLMLDYYANFSY